ncbi:MAG: KpsF/GutQ family sugar-phosphate isomerase [Deltaproteobacteria bacterium]|nr:KpsF/GutQ family sugar-phosphate isomerase [Deltaproteobacteria bacterium]
MNSKRSIRLAREVLQIEAEGILSLIDRVGINFHEAINLIYKTRGRVIVTGIGKSGIIGRKIAATLNSTGTPALFLHPAEAIHGDLGIVTKEDVVLIISNSGETEEVITLIPSFKRLGVPIIAFTGNPDSTLAKYSDIVIDTGVKREACPLGIVPTASTTSALAMGDALSVALLEKRQFGLKEFRKYHPGGSLGKRLSPKVKDLMVPAKDLTIIRKGQTIKEVLDKLGKAQSLWVLNRDKKLLGVITDIEKRTLFLMPFDKWSHIKVEVIMYRVPSIGLEQSIIDGLKMLKKADRNELAVIDENGHFCGAIFLHDILNRSLEG